MDGLVKIEITGMPMDKKDFLWVQELPNGDRHIINVAELEFGQVIMDGVAKAHRAMRKQEAELFKGIQGA